MSSSRPSRPVVCGDVPEPQFVASDGDVVVQMEIRDLDREIIVTREAFEDLFQLSSNEAAELTLEQRCDRVRKNLPAVIAAVHRKIDLGQAAASLIVIYAGEM